MGWNCLGMDKKLKLTSLLRVKAVLRRKSCYSRVYPAKRHVRQDQSGQIEENASDIQYILQTIVLKNSYFTYFNHIIENKIILLRICQIRFDK